MTTFVVALFLPYTVDFKSPSEGRENETRAPLGRAVDGHDDQPQEISNLASKLEALLTPTDNSNGVNPFDLQRGVYKAAAALHFAKPDDPKTLRRTDSSVPEWGKGLPFNQPKSRVNEMPPSTLAEYSRGVSQWSSQRLQRLYERPTYVLSTPQLRSGDQAYSEFDWTVKPAIHGNGALTNAVRAAEECEIFQRVKWVGTIGFPTDSLKDDKKAEICSQLESEYDALTVFVNDKDFQGHYSGYCKTMLWPILHYQVPDEPKSKAFLDHSWTYYVKINEAFAERILKSYQPGDTIWIHDYHLCLVPGMLRKQLPNAKIGFFMHAAFPSSEVFRCLANRTTILEGLLGSNLVVFQVAEYAEHFLQTCSRILLAEAMDNGVRLESGFVDVTHVPMGVVPQQICQALLDPAVHDTARELYNTYSGKTIIVGKDQFDITRGVHQKLLAFEMFLQDNPEWRNDVVLFQIASAQGTANKELEIAVAETLRRILETFTTLSHQPVVFYKQDIGFSQYLAILLVADILFVNPLRDGMNLSCHEYILCQDGRVTQQKSKHGPLILSEFTGSAALFNGAEVSVNPWDTRQCSRAIKEALEMTVEEKKKRYGALSDLVLKYDANHWAEELSLCLDQAHETQQQRHPSSVPQLPCEVLVQEYKKAQSRLLILDYEGTLAGWCTYPKDLEMFDQRVLDVLAELIAVPDRNIVYVTSAKTPNELDRIFRTVDGIGLIAENGCFVRPFGSDEWEDLAESAACMELKAGIMPDLEYYSQRLEGSQIIERTCSLALYYGNVRKGPEMESAMRLAGDCVNQINSSCEKLRLRAVPIKKAIVVEPKDVNKMTASEWALTYERKRRTTSNRGSFSGGSTGISSDENPLSERIDSVFGSPEARAANVLADFDHPVEITNEEAQSEDNITAPIHFSPTLGGNSIPPTVASSSVPSLVSDRIHATSHWPEFLLVAGDDREDEPMFRWAKKQAANPVHRSARRRGSEVRRTGYESDMESGASDSGAQTPEKKIPSVFSVSMGERHTQANFSLRQGPPGFVSILQRLAQEQTPVDALATSI